MPYIRVSTNRSADEGQVSQIKEGLGRAISLLPGKSETWLMVEVEPEKKLFFQGSDSPCAMVQVTLYGKGRKDDYQKLASSITGLVGKELDIPGSRIYVSFVETPYWSFDSDLF